jgi:hypothetical protein
MSFMLLGILNAQVSGGGAGAFDLLETTTLASSASSVTFSGLDAYSDYKHLQIRAVERFDGAFSTTSTELIFNGDTSNSYSQHKLEGDGSSVSSDNKTNQDNIDLETTPRANADSGIFSSRVIDILDFSSTNKNTTVRCLAGLVAPNISRTRVYLISGAYYSTDAITSLTFQPALSANYIAGTRFSLYGVK